MLNTTLNLPAIFRVIDEPKIKIYDILKNHNMYFENIIILLSKRNSLQVNKLIECNFSHVQIVEEISKDHCEQIVKQIKNKVNSHTLLIGFGGGGVTDVTKFVSSKLQVNYMSIPTTLSNDGIYTTNASLKGSSGIFESCSAVGPLGIIINLNLLKTCPEKNIISGIGEIISNISSLKDWILARKRKKERMDDLSYSISKLALDSILHFDWKKIEKDNEINFYNDDFLTTLSYSLVLCGFSMSIFKSSRPSSGSEHNLTHTMNYLKPNNGILHGFMVSYFTLITEKLRGENVEELIKFYRKIGLPTSYKDINLSREELIEIIQKAPSIRERFTILNENITLIENKEYLEKLII